jgi:hypothetical protein
MHKNIIEIMDRISFNVLPRGRKDDEEYLKVQGIMRFRRIPDDWNEEEYKKWWLPEWNDNHTQIIKPARMSPKEKERYTVEEFKNILTTQGRTYILTYMSSSTPNTPAWAQYFAVGTFPLTAVSPGDTSVQTEIFRAAPNTVTITGTQLDLSTLLSTSSAVGILTNAGLYGVAASSTSGSGTLMTHALLNSFNKTNSQAFVVDYLLNVQ